MVREEKRRAGERRTALGRGRCPHAVQSRWKCELNCMEQGGMMSPENYNEWGERRLCLYPLPPSISHWMQGAQRILGEVALFG